eukprot:Gb_12340 [translate_table: standard]
MNMEVNNEEPLLVIDNCTRALVDLKRKRASRYAAYLTAVAAAAKRVGPKQVRSNKRLKTEVWKCCSDDFKCCSGKAVLHNYDNFRKSGLPARVMYYWKGEWTDFPVNVTASLKEGFRARKSAAEVSIKSSLYLVDFLRMVQIDLRTGFQRSIAWIDENGKCFFPKYFFEGNETNNGCLHSEEGNGKKHGCSENQRAREIEVKVEIGISGTESSKSENCGEASVTHQESQKFHRKSLALECSELEQDSSDTWKSSTIFPLDQSKQTHPEYGNGMQSAGAVEASSRFSHSGLCTSKPGNPEFGIFGDKLVKLEDGDQEYVGVQNRFLAGLSTLVTFSSIVGIYRNLPTSTSGQTRLQAFQKHVEITKKFRGNANVRYAWHGTSRKGVAGIILHGFGQTRTPKNGAAYGIGVYLAPEDCSHVSAAYSDVDENGLQHMVLCRVIMGNMEQVQPGSQQFHPSSEHFDSGVDDLKNPKRYIIWSTHMNTHIHPEYVVSFKVPPQVHEYWAGLKANGALGTVNCSPLNGQLRRQSSCEMVSDQQSYPVLGKEAQQKLQAPAETPVKIPTSAWMPFPMLFSVIGKHLSSSSITTLEHHYTDFKQRRITREDLIKRVRMIAGDKLLIAAIKSIKSQKNGMQRCDRGEQGSHSVLGTEKVHLKNDFTSFLNQTSVIGRTSGLQGQSRNSPKPVTDAQQFSCKNEFTSLNGQALY